VRRDIRPIRLPATGRFVAETARKPGSARLVESPAMTPTPACRTPPLEALAALISAEFNEMPGMRLTFAQARRLWNLPADECRRVLDALVAAERLVRDEDGRYCRWEECSG